MADGKYFLLKLRETFVGDTDLQGLFAGGVPVEVAKFTPVGNSYPQVCLHLDEGKSEEIFPAGHYELYVCIYEKKDGVETPYSNIKKIVRRINELINRKASSISEINVSANEGLRVAQCLKQGGMPDYDKSTGLYYDEIRYKCVISEGESFDPLDSGNQSWI